MKKFVFLSILSGLIFIISCHKPVKFEPNVKIPVLYYLTENDKALFNFFKKGKTVKYMQGSFNEWNIVSDTIEDIKFFFDNKNSYGEQLRLSYRFLNTNPSNDFINYHLEALPDNQSSLYIGFGLITQSNMVANISTFMLNPNEARQKGYYIHNNDSLHFEVLDSVVFQNKVFYNLFYLKNGFQQGSSEPWIYCCYYSKTKGVVGVKSDINKLWVLQE